jgi:hypothetical protein
MNPDLPPPARTDEIKDAVDETIFDLGASGYMSNLGEGAAHVHMIASLIAQLRIRHAEAIALAYSQDCDWPEIAHLAGLTVAEAKRLEATVTAENYMAH